MYAFTSKRTDYEKCGWNALALISPFPSNDSVIWVSDAGIIKQIVNDRVLFVKPLENYIYKVMSSYGRNVITTEGDEWKRHRRISQPAFSEINNKTVWDTATNTMTELFADVWGAKPETYVYNLSDIAKQITLTVLSIAGFGKEMTWKSDSLSFYPSDDDNLHLLSTSPSKVAQNHPAFTTEPNTIEKRTKDTMSFTQSLSLFSTHIVMNLVVPSWLKLLTSKMRKVKKATSDLGSYVDELIDIRVKEGSSTVRGDLLSSLVDASYQEDGSGVTEDKGAIKNSLNPSELRGNILSYIIAGHETTSHTLCYMYTLLALYPGEQEKLYEHINEIVGEREATFDDFRDLTLVMAAFYETLRMFTPTSTIPKRASASTIFSNVSAADARSSAVKNMYVPEGSLVYIHSTGVHYNARYWPDPYTFKPERFLGEWNKDAFLAFSGGARSCIGRRFAEVEAVAVTVALLRNYSIHLVPEKEEEYERLGFGVYERTNELTSSVFNLTLTPSNVPLVFKKRISA